MKHAFICIGALCITAALMISYGCKGEEQKSGIVTLKIGSVKVQRPGLQPADLLVKDRLAKNDVVITGAMSMAVVQFSENCVVQVQENTMFKVLSAEKNNRDLYVRDGEVLAKLMRTGDNTATVRTPTAIAAVRGTKFSVNHRGGGTKVAVTEGSVAVRAATADDTGKTVSESKEETLTAAGSTAEVAAAKPVVSVRAITEQEKQTLRKIEAVPLIQDPDKKSGQELESAVKKAIGFYPGDMQDRIKQLLSKDSRTIDEIRAAFNRVDEITLYSGRVIQGAIVTRGAEYKILAPEGMITVPEDEIKDTVELK